MSSYLKSGMRLSMIFGRSTLFNLFSLSYFALPASGIPISSARMGRKCAGSDGVQEMIFDG